MSHYSENEIFSESSYEESLLQDLERKEFIQELSLEDEIEEYVLFLDFFEDGWDWRER